MFTKLRVSGACAGILATAAGPTWGTVSNTSLDWTGAQAFIACINNGAGEYVTFNGSVHTLYRSTTTDNHTSAHVTINPQGLSATGLTTGTVYRAVGVVDAYTINFNTSQPQNAQTSATFLNRTFFGLQTGFSYIGQGTGTKFVIHQLVHLTVNANGDVTADFSNFTPNCL
jgi:hypothetical protein